MFSEPHEMFRKERFFTTFSHKGLNVTNANDTGCGQKRYG
jgi:hypothetical protein